MKKKIVIAVIILVVLLLGKLEIEGNLRANSVYYIKNMEHKGGFEPELMVLIDNLDITENRKVEGFVYDTDGGNSIQNDRVEKKRTAPQFRNGYDPDSGRDYSYEDTNDIVYMFNNRFKLINATDFSEGIKDIDISTIDEQAIKQELYELMKPVLEVHEKEPSLNLQWLFNLLNYDKFN